MRVLLRTLVEAVVIVVLGAQLGFNANQFAKRQIDPRKNYFDKTVSPELEKKAHEKKMGAVAAPAAPTQPVEPGEAPDRQHLVHPFQSISVEEVISYYNDPDTSTGAAVFIDARKDEDYADGHIPGAVQCDYYNLDSHMEKVLASIRDAEVIIVYCNGGKCDDSQQVCRELIDSFDISYEKVFLFEGGWQEWIARKQPVETTNQ